jgi:two-component system, oxyanion-binding sensor
VLGCRLEWTQRHPDRLQALVRALHRSALWCEDPENHGELSRLLAEPRFVGAPAEIILRGLSNRLRLHPDGELRQLTNFYVPASHAATFPWVSHGLWFYSQMVRWGQVAFDDTHVSQVRATYRPDLYRLALAKSSPTVPSIDAKVEGGSQQTSLVPAAPEPMSYGPDGFFDGVRFDPDRLVEYLRELTSA